ncbi:MAG: TIGR04206 family protein [Halobacteriales archaeon]
MRPGRRLAVVAAVGAVPWVVVRTPDAPASLVASFGLIAPATGRVTLVTTYLFELTRGLPASLLAWPVASLLYAVALGSAASGWSTGREDLRITGGLLVLVGASLLPLSLALGRPAGVVALPVGTAAGWLAAWWAYRHALRRIVTAGGAGGR